jgi:hypothetical protein
MCLHETYSRVRVVKYSSDTFPIQNGLKQRHALSELLFNFVLEYAIRVVKENQVSFGIYNKGTLSQASRDVVVDTNAEKKKYVTMSCQPKSE